VQVQFERETVAVARSGLLAGGGGAIAFVVPAGGAGGSAVGADAIALPGSSPVEMPVGFDVAAAGFSMAARRASSTRR